MASRNNATLNGNPASNQTAQENWFFLPIFGIPVMITVPEQQHAPLNALASLSAKDPFTISIIHLLIANIINTVCPQIFEIVALLRSFPALGWGFYETCLYSSYIVHVVVYNSHFFIALNRIWAVSSPIAYRAYQTKRVAVIASISLWAYIHLVFLPAFVRDQVYHTLTLDKGQLQYLRRMLSDRQKLTYGYILVLILLQELPYLKGKLISKHKAQTSRRVDG